MEVTPHIVGVEEANPHTEVVQGVEENLTVVGAEGVPAGAEVAPEVGEGVVWWI
jgi:hypothetical protein